MSTADMGSTNTVLGELRRAVAAVETAEADVTRAEKKASAARRASMTAHSYLAAAQDNRDRLARAADVLQPDWREWPWVTEDGFWKKVPDAETLKKAEEGHVIST